MKRNLKIIAAHIFTHISKPRTNPDYPDAKFYLDTQEMGWSGIRDYCDGLTGGDLDCTQLDILTDMVTSLLKINSKENVA